jgi:opacity protein-like surface antigen
MMKMTRIALVAASLVVCSFTAQAANVEAARHRPRILWYNT